MIYLNGSFVHSEQALIHVSDRGLLLGDGVFETLLAVKGRCTFLEAHWRRLAKSLALLNIPLPFDYEELKAISHELLEKNDLLSKDAALRLTVTRGLAARGLLPSQDACPNYFITASHYVAQSINPFKLIISSLRRNEYSPSTQIKSINYLDNVLARIEANKHKANDALLLNTKGFITESTVANIFMVLNGEVLTPPLEDGLIPGITRAVVLDICSREQIPVREISIAPEILCEVSELFLTNSLMGIQPVTVLGEHNFEGNKIVTQRIINYYSAART